MPTLQQVNSPFPTFTGFDGKPIDGFLYIGEEGKDPEAYPIQVYWDEELTLTASQPISITAGFATNMGRAAKLFTSEKYSVLVKNLKGRVESYSRKGFALIGSPTFLIPGLVRRATDTEVLYGQPVSDAFVSPEQFQKFDKIVSTVNELSLSPGTFDGDIRFLACRTTNGDGGHGTFIWSTANLSAKVAADPLHGIYVAPTSDPTGASGAWVRQLEGPYKPQWFGADSTDTASQLDKLQACFDIAGEDAHIVIDEPYWIDGNDNAIFQSYGGVVPKNGQTVEFVGAGELRVIPNASSAYSVFQGYNIDGLTIINPKLTGDIDAHTGVTGEFGHGIFLISCYNVKVQGGTIKDMWGDGITIQSFATGSANALAMPVDYVAGKGYGWVISGVDISNCGRQGISVIGCDNFTISGCNIKDIRRTDPSAGIDCEPNSADTANTNGSITGNTFDNCQIGVMVTGNNDGVEISGNIGKNLDRGMQLQGRNVHASGNNLHVKPVSASSLNQGVAIGSGTVTVDNNTFTIDATGGVSAGPIGNHSTADRTIVKNNTFLLKGAIRSGLLCPVNDYAEFRGNTIIVDSTVVITTDLTSNVLIFVQNKWLLDDNTFVDLRATGTLIKDFDATGARTLITPVFNRYVGVGWQIATSSNTPQLLNRVTKDYYTTTGGLAPVTPTDVTFDISGTYTGLSNIRVHASALGGGENAQLPKDMNVFVKSVSDTAVVVTCTNTGGTFQTARVSIIVNGTGRRN